MNPWNPCGCQNTVCTDAPTTIELTREHLRRLLDSTAHSVQIAQRGQIVTIKRKDERPARTGSGPTFVGGIVVRLGYGDYAFHTDIPVAKGDTVDVETRYGVQEGRVQGPGTGGWQERRHGPLRDVLAVKAVKPR